ncbi:secreted protein [Melampsora americana]|nr:secreted protein [Melampsora americana]
MSARFFAILLTTSSAVLLASAQDTKAPDSMKCSLYYNANTNNARCNDLYTCTGGCEGPFVVGPSCLLITNATDFMGRPKSASDPPNNPVSDVKCTVGFGKNTAAAKICITETAKYSCTGTTAPDSHAMCHGCATGSAGGSGGGAQSTTPTTNTTAQGAAGISAGNMNNSASLPNTTLGMPSTANHTNSSLNTTAATPHTSPMTAAGNIKQVDVHQALVLGAISLLAVLV